MPIKKKQESVFSTPPEQLKRWEEGSPVSAGKLNRMVDAINRSNGVQVPRQVFKRRGSGDGGGGGELALDVRINKVIAVEADAVGQEEQDDFEAHGPHISCYKVKDDGTIDTTATVPAMPPGTENRVIDNYPWKKVDGTQIWNGANAFSVPVRLVRGKRAANFPQDKTWPGWVIDDNRFDVFVAPPDDEDLCI